MAEKGEVPITCHQDLVCPLCLDIFEDATLLTCQHSFCRRCLKKYDDSQAADQDHMLCPLCRKVTKLTDIRIAGLSSHVAINGLVDDYISSEGGVMAILHVKPKCTSCDGHEVAVSFCSDCDMYLCEDCHRGHQKMRFFAKHHTASMSEMEKGESNAYQQYNRCAVHELEKKDLFCDNCGVHVCLKCVVVNHHNHRIKNKEDFEKEVRLKTTDLGLRCSQEKDRVEKNIHRIEKDRQDVHLAMRNLESKVKKECDRRVQQLKKNEEMLLAEVKSIQKGFDGEFDELKAAERQRIKTVLSLHALVMVDRLASLEGESLSVHKRGCNELENLLKALSDEESTKCVRQMVESLKFRPADMMSLSIGHLVETPTLVLREVKLTTSMYVMAALSQDAVVVGYGGEKAGTECVYVSGAIERHMKDEIGSVHGLTFLTDGRPVLSHDGKSCSVYNTPEAHDAAMKYTCTEGEGEMGMCSDHQGNIYAVNAKTPEIFIFSGSNPKPERVIPTGSFIPEQICVAKTGVIICSSCNNTSMGRSEVRVYDREGHVGSSVTTIDFDVSDDEEDDNGDEDEDGNGDEDEDGSGDDENDSSDSEYLYVAVDGQDQVMVAGVEADSDLLDLVRYTLQGNRLVKQTVFKQIELPYPVCVDGWCYLVSLTPNLIAFASGCNLYFIKV